MKEKVIVSSFTLITSLTGYFYARSADKDAAPYVMIGGFIGAVLGEAIANTFCNHDNGKPKSKEQNDDKRIK